MNRRVLVFGVGVIAGLAGLVLAYAIADPRLLDNVNVFVVVAFGMVPALGAGLLASGLMGGANTVAAGGGILAGFGGLLFASLDVRSLTDDLLFVVVPAVVVRVVVGRLVKRRP